ncbi:MAG: DUF333 domain-containing protein [Planctomycetes bacterium]|jgi:hypothetical protein|nr:DUF333 domain-containing protein [Planctomycetota bacterium]
MKKTILFFGITMLLAVVVSGCQNTNTKPVVNQPAANVPVTTGDEATTGAQAGLANPASENCLAKGGKIEMRQRKIGEYGVCLLEDNRQCEEWALYRGQCPAGGAKITGHDNDAEVYCAITGGQVEGVGTATPMCKRVDGTYCNAQANLDGDCPDPNDPNPNAGNREAE